MLLKFFLVEEWIYLASIVYTMADASATSSEYAGAVLYRCI